MVISELLQQAEPGRLSPAGDGMLLTALNLTDHRYIYS